MAIRRGGPRFFGHCRGGNLTGWAPVGALQELHQKRRDQCFADIGVAASDDEGGVGIHG